MAGRKSFIEKAFLCVLGAGAIVEERIENILQNLEKKGEEYKKQKNYIVNIEKKLEGVAKKCFDMLDIPTKSELKRLERKIDRLSDVIVIKKEEG